MNRNEFETICIKFLSGNDYELTTDRFGLYTFSSSLEGLTIQHCSITEVWYYQGCYGDNLASAMENYFDNWDSSYHCSMSEAVAMR